MVGFAPGDRVHISRIGTGVVREERNGRRYVVEIKGRTMVVAADQLTPAEAGQKGRRAIGAPPEPVDGVFPAVPAPGAVTSLDLHGKTVAEAVAALDIFVNDALLASVHEVAVIHGRSGGRIKSAVHARLRELPPVRSFRIDPRNPGVTLVRF